MNPDNIFHPIAPPPRQLARARHAEWRDLISEQHGVLSRSQALRLGITPQTLRAQVSAGRWRRVLHRVYATFTGPLLRPARLMAALLYAGPPAVLSHTSAAEEWRMIDVLPDGPTHVTVPYGHNAVSHPPAVYLHRSRAFAHIVAVDGAQPRTSRADTIIDLATSEPTEVEAKRLMISLLSGTPVSVHAVAQQLVLRPAFRYRAALNAAVELVRGGSLSALEAEYTVRVESAHGLPAALRQVPFEVDGRVLWEDVAYDSAGIPLTVRLDGRTYHATPGIAFRDRRRDNAAELASRSRLVYGWAEVTDDPCGVAAEVATVLHRLGWTESPAGCGDPGCQLARPWRNVS